MTASLKSLSVGDSVAMQVPMTKPDLDGCNWLYWVKGEVVSVRDGYATVRHDQYEATHALDTGEQVNGPGQERCTRRIEPITDESKMRIAEGALRKSNYERRQHILNVLTNIELDRYTTEALERIAENIRREDELPEPA